MTLSVMRVAASVSPLDGGPATGILALSRELRLAGTEDTIYATDAHGAGHLRKTDLPSTNQPTSTSLGCTPPGSETRARHVDPDPAGNPPR